MQLNYKHFGEGQPLIILHGLFGMLDNWQTLARQFAEHFSVYIVDQRNHGKSPHDKEMDYYILAEDIANFIEQQDFESACVLGHSMGGKTAMQLAMDYTNKVDKLVVVDIAPKNYPAGHDNIFEAFFSIDLESIDNRKEADEQMQKVIKDFGIRQFLLKNLYRDKESKYHWKANIETIQEVYPAIIENSVGPFQQFDNPTLFIKGGNSERYIEMDDWATISTHFSDAKLEIIEDAGHWVHAEKPKELFTLVLDFLNDTNDS